MEENEQPINYNREAFLQPVNLGVLFAGLFAAFLLSNAGVTSSLILTLLFGFELVYLGIVPRLPRFQRNVRSKKTRERGDIGREVMIFRRLRPGSKKKFLTLRHLSDLINQNFEKLPYSSQGLLENIRNKIRDLLANYITLLDLHHRYRVYMDKTKEEVLKLEVIGLEKRLKETSSERLRAIKERRLRILEKRLQKIELAQEKFQICASHMETIEDAIRYIYEQSMTMNNAEEIGFQLDNLLYEVEETAELIEDLDQNMLAVYAAGIGDAVSDRAAKDVKSVQADDPAREAAAGAGKDAMERNSEEDIN